MQQSLYIILFFWLIVNIECTRWQTKKFLRVDDGDDDDDIPILREENGNFFELRKNNDKITHLSFYRIGNLTKRFFENYTDLTGLNLSVYPWEERVVNLGEVGPDFIKGKNIT